MNIIENMSNQRFRCHGKPKSSARPVNCFICDRLLFTTKSADASVNISLRQSVKVHRWNTNQKIAKKSWLRLQTTECCTNQMSANIYQNARTKSVFLFWWYCNQSEYTCVLILIELLLMCKNYVYVISAQTVVQYANWCCVASCLCWRMADNVAWSVFSHQTFFVN